MDIDKSQPDQENDLTALERRLAGWRPAIGGLDRDRMLFDAGRAAARAEGRSRLWQLATAALVFVTAGLGGLLANERSLRLALETQVAAQTDPEKQQPLARISVQLGRIEPPGPKSYLALTSRLAKGVRDLSSPDAGFDSTPNQPAAASSKSSPYSEPLRPTDLQRVLDL
jgi:hypothetical protein